MLAGFISLIPHPSPAPGTVTSTWFAFLMYLLLLEGHNYLICSPAQFRKDGYYRGESYFLNLFLFYSVPDGNNSFQVAENPLEIASKRRNGS